MTKKIFTSQTGVAGFFVQLGVEQKKLKHKKIFLLLFVFLGFETIFSLWNLSPRSALDQTQGYLSAFYFFIICNTLLYPVFIAVLASRLCDIEIKGNTLWLLYTLQEKKSFYNCKYLICLKYVCLTILAQALLIFGIGHLYHFTDLPSPIMIIQYLVSTFLVSSAIISLQQILSLLSQNQILPLIVGLGGSFLGLFSLFFPPIVTKFVLWGYYCMFTFVGQSWDREDRITTYYQIPFPWENLIGFGFFCILFYFGCRAIFIKLQESTL